MFNIGPLELMVLAVVGLIVLGPDRLPGFIRDAGRLLRSLRDMATGARQQLRDELGPEFADIDLRSLNPRTAVTRAMFGDDAPDLDPRNAVKRAVFGDDPPPDLTKYDPRKFDARGSAKSFLYGDDDNGTANGAAPANGSVSMSKGGPPSANGASANGASANGASANGASANGRSTHGTAGTAAPHNGGTANGAGPRPRPRPRPAAPQTTPNRYDDLA